MANDAHIALFNTFGKEDPHSVGLAKLLNELYPKFAKQLFHRNPFMERLVKSNFNPMEMLDYPICGKCETLAAPTDPIIKNGRVIQRCGCMAEGCGAITNSPVTLRTWMIDELKHKAPADIAEIAEIAVDYTALSMMRKAMGEYERVLGKTEEQRKAGLLKADGTPYRA